MCDPLTTAHEQLSSLFVSDVISDTICNRSSYTHCNLLWHLHFSAATQHSLPAPEPVTSHPVEWKMQTVSRAVLQQLPALHHQLKYNAVNVFPPFKILCRLLLCSSLKESIQTTSFQEAFVWRYKRPGRKFSLMPHHRDFYWVRTGPTRLLMSNNSRGWWSVTKDFFVFPKRLSAVPFSSSSSVVLHESPQTSRQTARASISFLDKLDKVIHVFLHVFASSQQGHKQDQPPRVR